MDRLIEFTMCFFFFLANIYKCLRIILGLVLVKAFRFWLSCHTLLSWKDSVTQTIFFLVWLRLNVFCWSKTILIRGKSLFAVCQKKLSIFLCFLSFKTLLHSNDFDLPLELLINKATSFLFPVLNAESKSYCIHQHAPCLYSFGSLCFMASRFLSCMEPDGCSDGVSSVGFRLVRRSLLCLPPPLSLRHVSRSRLRCRLYCSPIRHRILCSTLRRCVFSWSV